MISFSDLITLAFLGVAGYFTYLFKEAIDLLRHANFSNYTAYKEAIKDTERKVWRPKRHNDDVGINKIQGDSLKVTTKNPNGIAHTQDAYVDIADADPSAVMDAIDSQLAMMAED